MPEIQNFKIYPFGNWKQKSEKLNPAFENRPSPQLELIQNLASEILASDWKLSPRPYHKDPRELQPRNRPATRIRTQRSLDNPITSSSSKETPYSPRATRLQQTLAWVNPRGIRRYWDAERESCMCVCVGTYVGSAHRSAPGGYWGRARRWPAACASAITARAWCRCCRRCSCCWDGQGHLGPPCSSPASSILATARCESSEVLEWLDFFVEYSICFSNRFFKFCNTSFLKKKMQSTKLFLLDQLKYIECSTFFPFDYNRWIQKNKIETRAISSFKTLWILFSNGKKVRCLILRSGLIDGIWNIYIFILSVRFGRKLLPPLRVQT